MNAIRIGMHCELGGICIFCLFVCCLLPRHDFFLSLSLYLWLFLSLCLSLSLALFWCVSFHFYPYESYWLWARCSAKEMKQYKYCSWVFRSDQFLISKRLAGNATHHVVTRMKTVRCVWFRIMLYYLCGMFLKSAIVAVNLCGIWSLLCDQKPNEEINCNYEFVNWVHWNLLLLLFVVVIVLFFRWQYWRHINQIELKRCLIGKSKDRESADK